MSSQIWRGDVMDISIPEEVIERPHDYWGALWSLAPLAVLGGIAGGIRFMKTVSCESGRREKLWSLLFAVFYSGFIGVVGVMLMPFVFDTPLTDKMEIGLACVFGGLGTKSIDMLLRKLFNLSITDLKTIDEDKATSIESQIDEKEE